MTNRESIPEQILRLERAALDRWGAGDPDGFLEAYAEDVTYFDPVTAARIDGHDAMREYYRPWIGKIKVDRYEILNPSAVVTDDIALLTYNLVNFLRSMRDWVKQVHDEGKELVVCGDINIARSERDVHPVERKNVIGQTPEERALFEEVLGDYLVDVQRQLDPDNDRLFTWWAPWRKMRERNIGWRLDYVLASKALAAKAQSCVVQREFGTSDHGPVVLTLNSVPGT